MTTQWQQQGQLKCFTVSMSEVKHTSLLRATTADIDFHSASSPLAPNPYVFFSCLFSASTSSLIHNVWNGRGF